MSMNSLSRRAMLTSSVAALALSCQPFAFAQQPAEHPLAPALKIAYAGKKHIADNIKDYTCTMVKRERVNGKLLDAEQMFVKIRHEPFSVYMQFKAPNKVAGREVIYVHGANDGEMIAHEGKGLISVVGAVKIKPTSAIAMNDNRYPITEVGFYNLTKRLIEVAENDMQYGECSVRIVDATLQKRPVQMIEVTHPIARKNFTFNVARVFIDKEMTVPVRYESYDWPKKAGEAPELMEEYTYLNVQLNVGLKDEDFDPQNENYEFQRRGRR
jgi:hypothetical protein